MPTVDDGRGYLGGVQRMRGIEHDGRRHQEQPGQRNLQRHAACDPRAQAGTCENDATFSRCIACDGQQAVDAGGDIAQRALLAHGVETGEIRSFVCPAQALGNVRQRRHLGRVRPTLEPVTEDAMTAHDQASIARIADCRADRRPIHRVASAHGKRAISEISKSVCMRRC